MHVATPVCRIAIAASTLLGDRFLIPPFQDLSIQGRDYGFSPIC